LREHCSAHGLGKVLVECGFYLMWPSMPRWLQSRRVEIVSPSQVSADLEERVPGRRGEAAMHCFYPGGRAQVLKVEDTVTGG